MAVTLSDITSALAVLNAHKIHDQVVRTSFLAQVMHKRPHTEGQNQVNARVKLAGMANARVSSGAAVNRTTDFNTTNIRKRAVLDWARYEGFAKIDGLARDLSAANTRATANGGGAIMENLVAEEVHDSINDMVSVLTPHFYTGDPTASPGVELCGLDAICATGTFAGINPATSGQGAWAAIDATGALADLNWRLLRDELIVPYRAAANRSPEFIVCSTAMFHALADSIDDEPGTRGNIHLQEVSGASQDQILSRVVGAQFLRVDGVNVIQDVDCPANSFYAIHRDGADLEWVPHSPVVTDGLMEAMGAITGESGLEPATAQDLVLSSTALLVPKVMALGREGDFDQIMAALALQLNVKERRLFGRLVLS